MIAKNQIVVISGILVLLATATIAATSYNVQTAKAGTGFGKEISSRAQAGILCVAQQPKTCDTTSPIVSHNPGGGGGVTANSFGKDIVAAANPNK